MKADVKTLNIKPIIEKETGLKFFKNGRSHILEKCPFCGSGSGKNKSPALSIDQNKNIFNCFSCDKKGNTIEFIRYFKNLEKNEAIQYLIKNYSDTPIVEINKQESEQPDLSKRIFAIQKNNTKIADEYLKARGLDISKINGFYFFDSYKNSVCFIDSYSQLINYRSVEDNQKGFVKGSKIENAIYDKTFIPNLDKIYITEGVIDSLTLFQVGVSAVSVFTSKNEITSKEKFNKYFSSKNVILAFDNDEAGQKCTEYYQKFILNNYPVTSLKILSLPDNKDINDLLQSKALENYIFDYANYQTVKHDYKSEIIQDSKDQDKEHEEKGYFIEDSQYFKKRSIGKGKTIKERLSNYVMQIIFHIRDGSQDSRRLIKIQRNDGEISLIELKTSELLSLERFNSIIGSKLNKGCNFIGQHREHKNIVSFCYDDERTVLPLYTLGYNNEFELFAFSNLIINKNNEIVRPDELGILYDNDNVYYLPASSEINILNKIDLANIDFFYKEGNINFKTWSELLYKSYGIKGVIGICFLINSLFRDYIFNEIGFFPFLYLYGEPATGKTSFISFLINVFNNSQGDKGHSLNNSTGKGLGRTLAQYKNYIVYFKEYSQDVDNEILELLKTGYDGSGYTRANKTNDNTTNSVNIESSIVLDGNSLPTYEAAIFDRILLLEFDNPNFSKESETAFNVLKEEMKNGYGQIIREIIQHRAYFKEKFHDIYSQITKSIKYDKVERIDGVNLNELRDRTIKHIAFILAPLQIMQDKLSFPVIDKRVIQEIIKYSIEKEKTLYSLKPINIWWKAISSEAMKRNTQLTYGLHYIFDMEFLYIKFDEMYSSYTSYCKANNYKISDRLELKKLLTDLNYKPFMKGNRKDSSYAHNHSKIGSCLKFKIDTIENQKYIGDIELNLRDYETN
ncbi:MAG TPA: hypothetical protein DCG75_16055 [Bacteroidales bacterium]|nr:hypothetical protein [Bacteroidales bacterium]